MLMPETAMYKNDSSSTGHHDIGFSGQITAMQPEAKSQSMQERTYCFFRRRVLAANLRHHGAALRLRENIHAVPMRWPRLFFLGGVMGMAESLLRQPLQTPRLRQQRPPQAARHLAFGDDLRQPRHDAGASSDAQIRVVA